MSAEIDSAERARLERGEHALPHRVLGAHPCDGGVVIRAWHPDAIACEILVQGERLTMAREGAGVFSVVAPGAVLPLRYRQRFSFADGATWEREDPYRFPPTFGAMDEHLWAEGSHRRPWERLGARVTEVDGVEGTAFAVWAPAARAVSVLGDFCAWDERLLPMRGMGSSGVFELFVPGVASGAHYAYRILGADGVARRKADPFARHADRPPGTASRVFDSRHAWQDASWMSERGRRDHLRAPMAIYEVHLGSWARVPEEGGRCLTYREIAPRLADHVARLGFTHVELMPVMEHPFDPSWGYQVSGYYAPTSRFGDPDDFRFLVDHLHARGIGVILDWVPGHFVKDDWALARFDGTALFEHADPRRGEHPDWGTAVFNLGRNEVRAFLIGNALSWLREFHVDGLRVDAVASMLYLDYSRKAGEWVPNALGGREDLDAVSFLREMHDVVHAECPGAFTIAEESTAWPGVTAPTDRGGLGFTFKWNMGWMHDTLRYFSADPVHRRHQHEEMTFAMLYEHSERFVNALSHDEVVHGKGSLLGKMPGDPWQRFANLRCLLAYQWGRPGKKHLFMGMEFGAESEWSHEESLPWHLAEGPERQGLLRFVAALGTLYRDLSCLSRSDPDASGFEWIECHDRDHAVFAFERRDDRSHAVIVLNLTPVPRPAWRLGAPTSAAYRVVLDSDDRAFGGSGFPRSDLLRTEPIAWHGRSQSMVVDLPPLAALVLVPEHEAPVDPRHLRLREASRRAGILDGYHDVAGAWHATTDETRVALLHAMGRSADGDEGEGEAATEAGESERPRVACPSVPEIARAPRVTGVTANLYSLRGERSWGVGDLSDLARLCERVGERGGGFVAVSPLHVVRNAGHDISPYSPLSRLYRNPVYLDIEAVPEWADAPAARRLADGAEARAELAALRAAPLVEWERVAALKDRVLRALHAEFVRRHEASDSERGRAFAAFAREDEALLPFATFRALEAEFGAWPEWPAALREPASAEVAAFRAAHRTEVSYHAWLQFEMERQLAGVASRARRAGLSLGLMTDLALGSRGDGFDAWFFREAFAFGASAGAPPDPLGPEGQDWGFPPMDPWGSLASGHEFWRRLVRANLAHAGAMRVDHVLGLGRLFWIPAGEPASRGAYVRQPADGLLDVLAQESRRARAVVIGEDLGTVPEDWPAVMERWGVLSTRVLLFQREATGEFLEPGRWGARALALASTHDLPTLPGWRAGRDLELRAELGLAKSGQALAAARRDRAREVAALEAAMRAQGALAPGAAGDGAFVRAAHALLAATPSPLVGLQLADLAGETEPVNIPGLPPDRWPSWRRRLPPLESIELPERMG